MGLHRDLLTNETQVYIEKEAGKRQRQEVESYNTTHDGEWILQNKTGNIWTDSYCVYMFVVSFGWLINTNGLIVFWNSNLLEFPE